MLDLDGLREAWLDKVRLDQHWLDYEQVQARQDRSSFIELISYRAGELEVLISMVLNLFSLSLTKRQNKLQCWSHTVLSTWFNICRKIPPHRQIPVMLTNIILAGKRCWGQTLQLIMDRASDIENYLKHFSLIKLYSPSLMKRPYQSKCVSTCLNLKNSLIFLGIVRSLPQRSVCIKVIHSCRLWAFPIHVMLDYKGSSRTNTLAYFDPLTVTKKKN